LKKIINDNMHEFVLPLGPQHPAMVEPMHLRVTVYGERVEKVDLHLGYNHRGVEKALEQERWFQGAMLAGRICGICSNAHTATYTFGVEKLGEISVSERGLYIRTMAAELERIQSHILLLAVVGHTIGFDTTFHYIWRDREYTQEIFELITGKRVQKDLNTIGGVRYDLEDSHLKKISENLDKLEDRTKYYLKVFTRDRSIKKRLKGIGVLSRREARRLNVVGPVARASGVNYDMRNHRYFAYDRTDFRPVLMDEGDCWARIVLRLREVMVSIKMIQNLLSSLPGGDVRTKLPLTLNIEPGRESISRTEAPRGELFYYFKSNGLNPERVRVRTPTYANFNCINEITSDLHVADVPITVISLDPCIACCDRMTVVDSRTGKERILTHDELEKMRREND